MRANRSADFLGAIGQADLISTDVFDTLLLRTSSSERSRILKGERQFSSLLAKRGWRIEPDLLIEARFSAQRVAFRELRVRGRPGEVRLVDIISRQLRILGLPLSLLGERLKIELQVEKSSLFANQSLADILRMRRRAGSRIVAISDTTLPAEAVTELIEHFHGSDLIDRVYSSADQGLTKRDGDLFAAVAQAEKVAPARMAHIGDDLVADVQSPSAIGISAYHTPRPLYRRHIRAADGASVEAGRLLRRRMRRTASIPPADDAYSFGRVILGPIVAQFCLQIWLYANGAEAVDEAVLLFCARGGIGIRQAFERLLTRLSLPLKMRRENVMISRLVAARAALLVQSDAAVEELDREFRGDALADVADALGGRPYELPSAWREPFAARQFVALLFGASGAEVLTDIQQQNLLFARHLRRLTGDAQRVILCDTGLYGSTQRLLASGFPDLRVETIQFARSNYKGHSEEHFPKVAGLMVEQNFYSPFNLSSCVLRYWHLVESLFEPAVPSVRLFSENRLGEATANCGDITFGVIDPSERNTLLAGAITYINALPTDGGAVVLRDAEIAWWHLKHAITHPTEAALRCLEVGGRSVDFGRSDVLDVVTSAKNMTPLKKLRSLKTQLWREGAIAREFPVMKHALLPMFGSILSLRGLLARQR
ncbi:MAG TPA: HAD family hydrolase [Bradyrhizobium sp.]|nr:HAD family hydrolase [Bradyrhizobium sp.]